MGVWVWFIDIRYCECGDEAIFGIVVSGDDGYEVLSYTCGECLWDRCEKSDFKNASDRVIVNLICGKTYGRWADAYCAKNPLSEIPSELEVVLNGVE